MQAIFSLREIKQFQYNKILHVYSNRPNNLLSPNEGLFNFWTFFRGGLFFFQTLPINNFEENLIS